MKFPQERLSPARLFPDISWEQAKGSAGLVLARCKVLIGKEAEVLSIGLDWTDKPEETVHDMAAAAPTEEEDASQLKLGLGKPSQGQTDGL